MSEQPFILDTDPIIPTGIPATSDRVAELIADPTTSVTEEIVPLLHEEQQPTEEQIAAANAARGDEPIQHEEPS